MSTGRLALSGLPSGAQGLKDAKRAANAKAREDFVFHMTDWLNDLRSLAAVYEHPAQADRKQAGMVVAGFLYHVLPHLKAAGRLLLDGIPDAFEEADPTP